MPDPPDPTDAADDHSTTALMVTEVCPVWSFTQGGDRLIILVSNGDSQLLQQHIGQLRCFFGEQSVPVELVQFGVLRCTIPPHPAGSVQVVVALGPPANAEPVSNALPFTYMKQEEARTQVHRPCVVQ